MRDVNQENVHEWQRKRMLLTVYLANKFIHSLRQRRFELKKMLYAVIETGSIKEQNYAFFSTVKWDLSSF